MILLLALQAALAASPGLGADTDKVFASIDRDRNGRLTIGETVEWKRATFAAIDADDARKISLSQFLAFHGGPPDNTAIRQGGSYSQLVAERQAQFRRLDSSNDARLTLSEFLSSEAQDFAAADRNRDGYLDLTEFEGAYRGLYMPFVGER